jgi:hypothetical protein
MQNSKKFCRIGTCEEFDLKPIQVRAARARGLTSDLINQVNEFTNRKRTWVKVTRTGLNYGKYAIRHISADIFCGDYIR